MIESLALASRGAVRFFDSPPLAIDRIKAITSYNSIAHLSINQLQGWNYYKIATSSSSSSAASAL